MALFSCALMGSPSPHAHQQAQQYTIWQERKLTGERDKAELGQSVRMERTGL